MKLITPALVVAAAMAAYAPIANAGSAALVLNRTTLTNVSDAAGLWQHEGGNVFKSGVKIGQYALQRRVTTGGTTAPLNTAATTITLFLATASGSAATRSSNSSCRHESRGNATSVSFTSSVSRCLSGSVNMEISEIRRSGRSATSCRMV